MKKTRLNSRKSLGAMSLKKRSRTKIKKVRKVNKIVDRLLGRLRGRRTKHSYFLRSKAPPRVVDLHIGMTRVVGEPRIPEGLEGYRLRNGTILRISVSGKSVNLHVDSGSSCIFIPKDSAKELGILNGELKWNVIKIDKLRKTEKQKYTIAKDVLFQLRDARTLQSDVCILDPGNCSFLGGASLLKQYGCLQKFKKDGSCLLYFNEESKAMKKKLRKKKVLHECSLKGSFQQDLSGSPLKIKIDTGTPKTVLSETFIRKLGKQQKYKGFKGKPSKLRIPIGDGLAMESSSILVMENPGDDLCIGRDFFFKYEALIDYGNNFIFFTVNGCTYVAEFLDGFAHFRQIK